MAQYTSDCAAHTARRNPENYIYSPDKPREYWQYWITSNTHGSHWHSQCNVMQTPETVRAAIRYSETVRKGVRRSRRTGQPQQTSVGQMCWTASAIRREDGKERPGNLSFQSIFDFSNIRQNWMSWDIFRFFGNNCLWFKPRLCILKPGYVPSYTILNLTRSHVFQYRMLTTFWLLLNQLIAETSARLIKKYYALESHQSRSYRPF